ncbi:MAG: hypothetical protein GY857_06445 [Desulfobacula sp.]|nr:hypothetical protein [Desulfobacula sp.]
MNKREKIILLLTIAAALYGILDYFVFSSEEKGPKTESEYKSDNNQILKQINSNLTSLLSTAANKKNADHFINMVESEWKKDPFTKLKKPLEKMEDSDITIDNIPVLEYSGFIQINNKIFAVINEMEYTIGEHIKNTAYKIIGITPGEVVLNINKDKQMIIYLKED